MVFRARPDIPDLPLNGVEKEWSHDRQSPPVCDLPQRAIPSHKLFLVVLVLLTGFMAASFSVIALAQQTSLPVDPFTAYADILPAQPRSAIVARGFSCRMIYNNYTAHGHENCTLEPSYEIISIIHVYLTDGIIVQTTFFARENQLRVGDLMLLTPPLKLVGRRMLTAFRRGQIILAWTTAGQTSLFRPVWKVDVINIS